MPPEILSLLGILAAVVLVLGGAYCFTRWAGRGLAGLGVPAAGGQLRVLDRAAVGKDHALLVVQAGRRYLLLGASPAGLTLLAELSEEEGQQWHTPPSDDPGHKAPDFRALLERLRDKKQG